MKLIKEFKTEYKNNKDFRVILKSLFQVVVYILMLCFYGYGIVKFMLWLNVA